MGTLRQKKLAKRIAQNLSGEIHETAGEMLANVGYSKSVAKAKPQEIIDSEGVKEELEILGISIAEADEVVRRILHTSQKEENQLKAAEQIYKRLGAYKDTEKGAPQLNVGVIIMPPRENTLGTTTETGDSPIED